MEKFQTKPKERVWEVGNCGPSLSRVTNVSQPTMKSYEKKEEECQGVGGELVLRVGFLGA
jgi:hypothetical protein